MRKILSLVLILALVLSSAVALADFNSATVVDTAERMIEVQPAEENEVDPRVSPTTGRSIPELNEMADRGNFSTDLNGFLGWYFTGEYYPIMVQHCGYHSAIDMAAPWYGSYADVIYELPKAKDGITRMCFLFNDFIPPYAGASRSTRVGYISIRQEWGCPYFYAGSQEDSFDFGPNTSVGKYIQQLGILTDENTSADPKDVMVFNGIHGAKKFLEGAYRWSGGKAEFNFLWNLPFERTQVLGDGRQFKNHTWKFASARPDTGDDAQTVYVCFDKSRAAKDTDKAEDGSDALAWYYNCMYQYEEDIHAYSRWIITDMENPEKGARPFVEKIVAPGSEVTVTPGEKGGQIINIQDAPGDDITFANIIIQAVEDKWPGNEMPYPVLTGTGNADYFMGGKHLKGVWQRETDEDRTVFYGEDGEEIELQPGRTIIIIMDYNTVYKDTRNNVEKMLREVRYE